MVLSMNRPWKHPKSGVYYYRKAIPDDLRKLYPPGKNGKQPWEEKRTLNTKSPAEARVLHAQVSADVEAKWASLRKGVVVLSQKQVVALAGEAYAELVARFRDEPHEASIWTAVLKAKASWRTAGKLEQWIGPSVDELLGRKGLKVDAVSRSRLLVAYHDAVVQAVALLKRHAEGDYTPDPMANRFPTWERPEGADVPSASGGISLRGLVADWWAEARAAHMKPSTHEGYRASVEKLIQFLGHDDATRVTKDDVVAFKDFRLKEINPRKGKPISAKTVKDADLAGIRRVLGWAVANKRLPSNPAVGVTVKLGKAPRLRSSGFTEDEASALLSHAWNYRPGREKPKTAAAKRWVFWLCAYTGARLGEVVQLRKQDVRREGKWWFIRITPEAGTVKTNEARDVPLHPHLVELGFPAFVSACPNGHLFITPHPTKGFAGPWQATKNRLSEFAREVVKDPNVAPTHGWRHRWKTLARAAGIDKELRDLLQGHAAGDVAAEYGDHLHETMGEAVARMPRVAVPITVPPVAAPKASRRPAS
jgi:integrase